MYAPIWNELIFVGKVAGGAATVCTVFYSFSKWLLPRVPFIQKMSQTQDNVTLMLTNHIPHLQGSLNNQDKVLGSIQSDVTHLAKRQDDMHNGLHTLGESFLRHLEQASKEAPRKKRSK